MNATIFAAAKARPQKRKQLVIVVMIVVGPESIVQFTQGGVQMIDGLGAMSVEVAVGIVDEDVASAFNAFNGIVNDGMLFSRYREPGQRHGESDDYRENDQDFPEFHLHV